MPPHGDNAWAPPLVFRDLLWWASLLQALSLVGYTVADYSRGFLDQSDQAGEATFGVLSWVGLAAAGVFYLSHAQRPGGMAAVHVYPTLVAELLNIFSAACLCLTSALYGTRSSTALGAIVVCVEAVSSAAGMVASLVYVRAWEVDELDAEAALDATAGASCSPRAESEAEEALGDAHPAIAEAQSCALPLTPAARARVALCGNCRRGLARVGREFWTWELHSQLWNVAACAVYLVSSLFGIFHHFVRSASHDTEKEVKLWRLEALRLSSQGYVVGDVLFTIDAMFALAAWRTARKAAWAMVEGGRERGGETGRKEEIAVAEFHRTGDASEHLLEKQDTWESLSPH